MTTIPRKTLQKLPKIADIYNDKELIHKQNELNIILNNDPLESWIKEHPTVKGLKYLPIERVEYLLTCIFSRWEVRIKKVELLANSIVTTVELRCQNPLDPTDWIIHDGVGAMPIQVDKGANSIEFSKMKSNAIQLGAPASESYAIKDAAEKLGKLFGKDLNRKDVDYLEKIINTNESLVEHAKRASEGDVAELLAVPNLTPTTNE